jgi:hypothetical protein
LQCIIKQKTNTRKKIETTNKALEMKFFKTEGKVILILKAILPPTQII